MPELKRKTLQVEFKADGPEGSITARFATLNVVDHDRDITRKGAFGKQQVSLGLYNHNLANPTPAGAGDISEKGDAAMMDGAYALETFAGKETATYLKWMHDQGRSVEWSYAYYVTDGGWIKVDGDDVFEIKGLDVISVDPVGRGAGIDTRTVSAKGCGPDCEARRAGEQASAELKEAAPAIDYEALAEAVAKAVKAALEGMKAEEPAAEEPEPEPEPELEPHADDAPDEPQDAPTDPPEDSDDIFKQVDATLAKHAALQVPADPTWDALVKESQAIESRKNQLAEVK